MMYPDISYRKPHSPLPTPHSLTFIVLFSLFVVSLHAQEAAVETESVPAESELEELKRNVYLTYDWGGTTSWLNRIIKQTGRSNFVYKDFLAGAFFSMGLHTVPVIVPSIRVAAYYPARSTFNDMIQKSKTPLHIGVDALAWMKFEFLDLHYIRLNAGPGLHLFFLTSDRWHYLDLGGGIALGIELPLTARWTLLLDGYATLDSGNLGKNRLMEPFDIVYQYQVDLGFRCNKKKDNVYAIFGKKDKSTKERKSRKGKDGLIIPAEEVMVKNEHDISGENVEVDEAFIEESEPLRRY